MKVLLFMLLFALSANLSQAQDTVVKTTGKELFSKHCVKCHGVDGTKGLFGAKNLQVSKLSDADMLIIISNGKRIMPSWKKKLTQNEIVLVKEFVKTLRHTTSNQHEEK